jgi:HK97 family phage portal protein
MSVFDVFRRRVPETRAVTVADLYGGAAASYSTYDGPATAEALAACSACVDLIASTGASLPVRVLRRDGTEDEAHPLAVLVRDGPNATQSWSDFVQWLLAQVLLHGNGLVEVVTDQRGKLIALKPIPWSGVTVQMIGGRLVYDITQLTSITGLAEPRRRLLAADVLHIRDRSDDGVIGRSRLSRVAPVIAAGLAAQEAAAAMFTNGGLPSGTLQIPDKLSDDAFKRLQTQFTQKHTGSGNMWRVLLLQAGMTWKSESATPEDSQLLESRKYSTEEIARIFNVPPPLIQDYSRNTFTNSSAAGRWFAQFSLAPWVRKLEEAFRSSVLTEAERATHRVEFDLSGLLRGDDAQRWANWSIALDKDVLTPEEVRAEEGWAPRAAPEPQV